MVQCAEALARSRTFVIGVRCSLEVAEQRERDRGDRVAGLVAEQFDTVHKIGSYDLEVDSSILTPEQCAEQIKTYVSGHEPQALQRILQLAPPNQLKPEPRT